MFIKFLEFFGMAHSIKLPKKSRGLAAAIETDDIIPGVPLEHTMAAAKEPAASAV